MAVKPLDIPKVRGALMKPVQKKGCLQPEQDSYSVPELLEGNRCLQDHVDSVELQLGELQKAVRRREKIIGDLQSTKAAK